MPVEDINAERLATDFLNVIESSETTSEFWKLNAGLLSMVIFGLLFLGILFALILFARYGIKYALKK